MCILLFFDKKVRHNIFNKNLFNNSKKLNIVNETQFNTNIYREVLTILKIRIEI